MRECAKPVIAAINGAALGSGLALAASCDVLFASEKASLGLPEVDVGLLGGGRHAMRLFSHSLLRRMMLTGLRVAGPELYRLGVMAMSLVCHIAAGDGLALPDGFAALPGWPTFAACAPAAPSAGA